MKSYLLWIIAAVAMCLVIILEALPVDESTAKNIRNCKSLCSQCGCMGFHCGEECICECNKDTTLHAVDCIADMQANAKKLNTPFDLLIQGPSKNNLLKNALQFEQTDKHCRCGAPEKRSTVLIYKPTKVEDSPKSVEKEIKAKIQKRSVNNFEWGDDFMNSLIRPSGQNEIQDQHLNNNYWNRVERTLSKRDADEKSVQRDCRLLPPLPELPTSISLPALINRLRSTVENWDPSAVRQRALERRECITKMLSNLPREAWQRIIQTFNAHGQK